MSRRFLFALACTACFAGPFACGNSDDESGTPAAGDAGAVDASESPDASSASRHDAAIGDAGTVTFDAAGATTTIAAARAASVTTPITVNAIVTALHGAIPDDVSEWYVEDLAGGPSSGVVVYCDPDKTACPTIRAPARWTVVQITGALELYQGQMELVPTAQTILADAGTPPPIPTVTMADIAPSATSDYRGVLVKLASGTRLTVDDVAPSALLDTSCTSVNDAGARSCSYPCSPPAYSGFTAHDAQGNEVNIEAQFFATDPLQSSPECLGQPGVVPVTSGMTFSAMEGVLDYDSYAKQQQLSPVTSSDYTTP
jgi:hypothetical protein